MPTAYVTMLNEISEARSAKQRAQGEERARSEAEAARGRLTPLDERLGRLLATIPVEVQAEGLSLTTLQGPVARARARSLPHWRAGRCASAGRI